jgi:O-antigen/teichoic acid export membrane protein
MPIVEGPPDQRSDEGLVASTFAGRAVRAGAQLLLRTVMLRILTLVGTLVLTRILAPEAYGAFGILAALVTLLSAFGDVGLGASLIQQRDDPSPAELATTWTTQVLIATAGVVVLWAAAPWVVAAFSGLGGDAVMQFRVLAVGLLWASLRSLPSVMLERRLQYLPIAVGEIAGQVVFYAIGISGALLGNGIWGLCIGAVAQSLTAMLIVNVAWRPSLRPGMDREILRRQMRFGAAYQSSYALAWARDGAIPVVVGLLAGPAAAGVFTVAIRIASITSAVEDIVALLVIN